MPDPSTPAPVPLTAIQISLSSREFDAISGWPFADPFVLRLLNNDIPQRVQFGNCRIWIYRDPEGRLVGFGTLDLCDDYASLTSGRPHPYIPLLAVNPTIKSRGYGTSIVQHLIGEAALLSAQTACYDVLFLDVYTTNLRAISMYRRCGFTQISPDPIPDPQDGGATYIIMGKRLGIDRT